MPIIKRSKNKTEQLTKFEFDNSSRSRTRRTINKHKYEKKMRLMEEMENKTTQKDLFELQENYCNECGELIKKKMDCTKHKDNYLHNKCFSEIMKKERELESQKMN